MPKDTIATPEIGPSPPGYVEFLEAKVALARQSVASGEGRSNDDVEASFGALRRQIEEANR
ncbi:hypothetical protein [Rhizobium sp. AN80A]|uniref:hypothetical protein n=1 Tax=Rhizobium sp. AN80A TaxID=3040673 RepID=UPI0024B34830|nr:hypothetical protein [Rhizobium sp. AN80A]